ncbi:carbohydrate sulfotransferase 10-like isoform X2 [Homarus americanus]|uniref:carbohydrate sulfotransferase 10-like isoform X2 n=1 Tax=Homarus americanus TaxID=6706 RepID=UPI001C46539B|nr:carbohydrate sulfotransferase 10-like isoform X2 [Homarus americanus]
MRNRIKVTKLGVFVVVGLVITFQLYNKTKRKFTTTSNGKFTNSTQMNRTKLIVSDVSTKYTQTFSEVSKALKNITDPLIYDKSMLPGGLYSDLWNNSSAITENALIVVNSHRNIKILNSKTTFGKYDNLMRKIKIENEERNDKKLVMPKLNRTVKFVEQKEKQHVPGPTMVEDTQNSGWGDRRDEFTRRASVVRSVCRQFKVTEGPVSKSSQVANYTGAYVERVYPNNFHLARSASTLACLINKVASTSLAVSLLKADRRPVPDQWSEATSPHSAAAVLKPQTEAEFNFARKYFFKFLMVRHPFQRLLSAYRDKVERADHWSLKEFRRHIMNHVRKAMPRASPPHTAPSLDTDEFFSHWAPYWSTCAPCSLHYDVIAKLETVHLDLKHVWQQLGLKQSGVPWSNRNERNGSSSQVNHYYQGLHPRLVARVYQRFALDFHLFQYDILDVFKEGGHCQTNDCTEMASYIRSI